MSSATVNQENEVKRRLCVIAGPDADQVFDLPVSGAVLIGRAKETLTQLKDETVSRKHCRLDVGPQGVLLVSFSESGTLVNDCRVTQQELRHDDVIRLGEHGETRLRFEDPLALLRQAAEIQDQETVRPGGGGLNQKLLAEHKTLVGRDLGHFHIDSLLSAGNSGTLFLARDTRANRDVALKVFAFNKSLPQAIAQLRLLVALRHPHLVDLYEVGQAEAQYWAALERVDGGSLEQQLGQTRALDWKAAVRQGLELAQGLQVLHGRGFVHGGVVPSAVLLTRAGGQVKLAGVWRARPAADCQAGKTDVALVTKNLAYMPPERSVRQQPATARGDVYSLGAVLYHLLTGRKPFDGATDQEIIALSDKTEPAPPRSFQPSLPEPLERAVLRMLAKRPEQRYENAQEVLAALQQLTVVAPPPPPPPFSVSPPPPPPFSVSPPPPPGPSMIQRKLRVTCSSCGQVLHARKQFAGTKVRCPSCKELIALPGRASLGDREQPEPEEPLSLRHPRGPAPAWKSQPPPPPSTALRTGGRYLLLVLLLLGTLAVSMSGLLLEPEPKKDKKKNEQPAAVQNPDQQAPKAPK